MLALCWPQLSPLQQAVVLSYVKAFASRGLYIALHPVVAPGPYLFTDGVPITDTRPHCLWVWDDRVDVPGEAADCAWVWHHGPNRSLLQADPRVILLPRNDLFEIRGIENTAAGWAEYRAQIATSWEAKRDEVYFVGAFTGPRAAHNSRVAACRLLGSAGIPAHVGLLPDSVPGELARLVPVKPPEPLHVMGQYKFVLSLWGNHPFNPRLYRGLEAGSLVFHQATPTVQFIEDGILRPGEHYVEVQPDLSDLPEQVTYYQRHPAEARAIAQAGHAAWRQTLYVEAPYTLSDVVWERFLAQPRWAACRAALDVHW